MYEEILAVLTNEMARYFTTLYDFMTPFERVILQHGVWDFDTSLRISLVFLLDTYIEGRIIGYAMTGGRYTYLEAQ